MAQAVIGWSPVTIVTSIPARPHVAIASFASNVARMETAIVAAEANDRRVCLVGRSMFRMTSAAKAVGLLDDVRDFVDISHRHETYHEEICLYRLLLDRQICSDLTEATLSPDTALWRGLSRRRDLARHADEGVLGRLVAIGGREQRRPLDVRIVVG